MTQLNTKVIVCDQLYHVHYSRRGEGQESEKMRKEGGREDGEREARRQGKMEGGSEGSRE